MKREKKQKANAAASSMAPPMSDWSALPMELVSLISQRIDTEIDLIRFRSVCSNWRSSSIPKHHLNILPFKFRSLSDSINNTLPFCYLSKRSLFLIKPPQQTLIRRPWLVRIRQYSTGKTQILHPLLSYQSLYPFDSPQTIDFNELSVIHLGTDFIVDDALLSDYMYPEKIVAFTGNEKKPIVLGAFTCTSKPVLLKLSNENQNVIPVMSTGLEDICIFKGRPYVVDKTGRTVTLGPDDLTVQLVAHSLVSGGDIKFLVESEGDLLLVDVYESFGFDLMVNVLRLDEKERRWVNLMSLGDRVLFLGNGCSFSASASDLCVSKGNCVIFIDDAFLNFDFKNIQYGNCIFDLDHGRVSPLSDCPLEYFNLFWPPPEWIVKRS